MMIVLLLLSACVCLANTRSYERSPGERIDFTYDLEPKSCNIYFIPESYLNVKRLETEIVRQGRLERKDLDEVNCIGFQLLEPCGILIESLQSSCGGRFKVRDQNGNMALMVSLKMKRRVKRKTTTQALQSPDGRFRAFVFTVGAVLCLFLCACCCEECTSKQGNSETDAVAASAPEYEAVGRRSDELNQPSGTPYPAQSYILTGPLVHDLTDDVPPSYFEVAASAEHSVVPSAPLYSETEPWFELEGMTFPSDSASVYTSDKLNFL